MTDQNYHTISDALEKYMALSGNNSASLKMQYMVRALEIWKEIRNDILKTTSHKWVQVDKSSLPYKIELPKCASLFLNITIKNKCDEYVPLSKWQNMPTTPYVDVTKKCTCNNDLKNCIESNETITENIVLYGTSYTKKTKTKVYSNGDVYIETSTPYEKLDEDGSDKNHIVEMIDEKKLICKLSIKECGCIEVSQENLKTIESCCCQETINQCNKICNDYFTQPNDIYLSQNDGGYFSYSEPNRHVYLYGSIPSQVIVNFQTTGESEEDELIPNYAFMAFVKGMDWINSRYSKTMNRLEKRQYEEEYASEKSKLELKLPRNKINIYSFNNPTKEFFAKW